MHLRVPFQACRAQVGTIVTTPVRREIHCFRREDCLTYLSPTGAPFTSPSAPSSFPPPFLSASSTSLSSSPSSHSPSSSSRSSFPSSASVVPSLSALSPCPRCDAHFRYPFPTSFLSPPWSSSSSPALLAARPSSALRSSSSSSSPPRINLSSPSLSASVRCASQGLPRGSTKSAALAVRAVDRLAFLSASGRPLSALPWRHATLHLRDHLDGLELPLHAPVIAKAFLLLGRHRPLRHSSVLLRLALHHVFQQPQAAAEVYAAPSEEAVERIVHATASQLLPCFPSSSSSSLFPPPSASSLFPSSSASASSEPAECLCNSASRLSARAVGLGGAAGETTERATEASERGALLAGGGRSIFFDASAREFFSEEDQLCILLGYHHAASLRPILGSLSPFLFRLLLFSGAREPLLPAGHPSAGNRSAPSLLPWVVELCRQPGSLQRVLQGLSRDDRLDHARSLLEEETQLLDMLASALSAAELHQPQAPRRDPVSEAPARPRRHWQFPGDTSGGCPEAGRTRERSRTPEGDIEETATGRYPCKARESEDSGSSRRVEKGEDVSLSALDQVAWRLLDRCCERSLLLERGQGGQGRSRGQLSCLPLLSTAGTRILLHLVRSAEARTLHLRVRNEEPLEGDIVHGLNQVPTQRGTDSDKGHLRGDCASASSSPGNPVASVEGQQRCSDVRGVKERGEEKPRERSLCEAPDEVWTVASLRRLRQTASRLQRMLLRSPLCEFSHADALVALPAAAVFLDQVQGSVASLLQRAESAEGGARQGETAPEQQLELEAAERRRGFARVGDSSSEAAAPSWGEGEPRSEELEEQTKERRALGQAVKARVFQEVDRREAEATLFADDVVDCMNAIVRVRSTRLSTVALLLRTLCNRTDDFSPEQREDLSVGLRLLHASLQRQLPSPRERPRGSSAPSSLVRLHSREARVREEGPQTQSGGGGEMQVGGKSTETTHQASKTVLPGQQKDSQEIVFFSCRDACKTHAQVSGAERANRSRIEAQAGDTATEREEDHQQVIAFLERIQEHKILERKHRSLISWSNRRW